ncbi:hypothetical protein [Candidatus Phytoplasma pyri]|uniref:hypothetical protein n=1 Tax=Candidatus Phytoplasma pyri TaxID=47566 RepID=UPI00398362FF
MDKNKIIMLKTKLTKLKCQNIEIIQDNENRIKEINFDFKGIYINLQFLQIEFYQNGNLKQIQCFCCRLKPKSKDFTYRFYDENNPTKFRLDFFLIVPGIFKYLKVIGNILKYEYFIPIMDDNDDDDLIYDLMSTKTFYIK